MMKSVDITSILILAYLLAFLLFFEKFVAQDDFFIRQKRSKRKEKVFPALLFSRSRFNSKKGVKKKVQNDSIFGVKFTSY